MPTDHEPTWPELWQELIPELTVQRIRRELARGNIDTAMQREWELWKWALGKIAAGKAVDSQALAKSVLRSLEM